MHVEGADQQAFVVNDEEGVDAQALHHFDSFDGELVGRDGMRRRVHHFADPRGVQIELFLEGTAQVTVDDTVKLVTENQSVYIPLGARHRMANPGKVPMVLIEVQTGSYLGEDDIVRFEDRYGRV